MRILTFLLLAGCSRDEPATDEDSSTPEPVVVVPTLAVSSPERGSFVDGGSIKLSGAIAAGSAKLAGLTLGGTDVPVASDGSFSLPIGLSPGINIFGLRAVDEGGERAVDGRAHRARAHIHTHARYQTFPYTRMSHAYLSAYGEGNSTCLW